jgi:hypothetical protein
MNEVVIPLKIQGIAQMKAELRELKGELANATDPAQMTALAQKAGVLTDKIKDANEAVKVFASGSKFEQVSNGIGGIKSSLMSLDFEEAAEKSKVFATALGGINKADISKSLKGAMDMTKTLGGAFLKLGLQILMNPIFLLVTVIAGVVAAVGLFLNKLGVLSAAMDAIKAPFKAVVQGFKDLTDWMGITDNAAEENARVAKENAMAHVAANNEIMASLAARTNDETSYYDNTIAEQKALGKNTYKLELKQIDAIKAASSEKIYLMTKSMDALANLTDDDSKKKYNKLNEDINAEYILLSGYYSKKKVLENTEAKRISDDADKKEKEASDKAKAAREKRIAGDKASQVEIDAAAKIVSDSKKTAQQIEIDDLVANYKIKIATAKKFKNDTTALVQAQRIQEAEINKKYDDEAKAKTAAAMAASHAANIAIIDSYNAELAELTDTQEQKLYDKYEADKKKFADNELALFNLKKKYEEDTTALKKIETDKQKAIDDKAFADKMKNIDAGFKLAQTVGDAIAFMQDTNITAQLKKVKKGSKEEEVLLKKQFEQNKKAQLAAAFINAAQAQVSILAQYPKFDGGFAMVAAMAGAAITSAMAIGKISSASFSGGGSTPGSPDSSLASTTAVAPASGPSLFGQANTGSQVTAGGGTNNITVTAVVSETEITSSQNHINNIQNNSVL